MKYRVMSVALAVSLALCPQPVFAAKAGNGDFPRRDGCGGNWRNDCRVHNRYQLVKLWPPLRWWARSVLISRSNRRGGSLAV